jgi:hypothetical protein
LLPQAGLYGALFLVFAAALPAATEARIAGLQFLNARPEIRATCTAQPTGRTWIRGVPGCSAPSAVPPHLRRANIGGKTSAALVADLHCRKSPSNVSQFMRQATGCLPQASASQRIVDVKGGAPTAWPANRFEPGPDRGMIETVTVGRLPDG